MKKSAVFSRPISLLTVVFLIAVFSSLVSFPQAQQTSKSSSSSKKEDEWSPYYINEKTSSTYFPQIKSVTEHYAKPITDPSQCWGDSMEVFEQLQSPEWQLCRVETDIDPQTGRTLIDPQTGETLTQSFLHICSTISPGDLMVRWAKNKVQEDSFRADRRRKTKYVPTNFFIKESDRAFIERACPIDNDYIMQDSRCSGSQVNGGSSQHYPPFNYKECQCDELKDKDQKLFVSDQSKTEIIKNPSSPCMLQLVNEQTKVKTKPNLWSRKDTKQLEITIDEIPQNGEVHLISSFDPGFWMNQPTIKYIVVSEQGSKFSFPSTNKVWAITRCKDGLSCQQQSSFTDFKISYKIITLERAIEEDIIDWSLLITIIFGFTMMLMAFLFFERRHLMKHILTCLNKHCVKKVREPIGFVEDEVPESSENGQNLADQAHEGIRENSRERRSRQDQIGVPFNRKLTNNDASNSLLDDSIQGDAQVGFDNTYIHSDPK